MTPDAFACSVASLDSMAGINFTSVNVINQERENLRKARKVVIEKVKLKRLKTYLAIRLFVDCCCFPYLAQSCHLNTFPLG